VNLFDLKISVSIQQVPTCYVDNPNDANSVIDLIFFCLNLNKINNHQILLELRYPSDYAPLVVDISLEEEFMQHKQRKFLKNSEKEANFFSEFTKVISNIDILYITSQESFKFKNI